MGWWIWIIGIFSLHAETVKLSPGAQHALAYPVSTTRLLIPQHAFENMVRKVPGPLRLDHIFEWVGLHPYPQEWARPEMVESDFRMGLSVINRHGARGLTVSCAGCHSAELWGRSYLGMTNRFPRAMEFFADGKIGALALGPGWFQKLSDALGSERKIYEDLREAARRIGIKRPVVLGLDTALAQTTLSMARRSQDEWASFDSFFEENPRKDVLEHKIADSKPAVWWNVKYKDKWFSDGSGRAADPVITNVLTNELGRGGDMHELDQWFKDNRQVIDELNEAVRGTEAPHWTDFFAKGTIKIDRARRGEALFNQSCAKCHGQYEKDWTTLKTVGVNYPKPTRIVNVGTDPGRYEGMIEVAKMMNPLQISKNHGVRIEPTKGYVPPPLVGIFARFPYFHNNSVPTLCAVLTRADQRPKKYFAREQNDASQDFDSECVGYPTQYMGQKQFLYQTNQEGMRNSGHDEGIFLKKGDEIFSADQKMEIVEFLKTL